MNGIAVVTSINSWLPSEMLFINNGFKEVDTYEPKFKLLVYFNKEDAEIPQFIPINKTLLKTYTDITINLSNQCPYSYDRVMKMKDNAEKESIQFTINELKSPEKTKSGIHPYGILSIFHNNEFIEYKPTAKKKLKKSQINYYINLIKYIQFLKIIY